MFQDLEQASRVFQEGESNESCYLRRQHWLRLSSVLSVHDCCGVSRAWPNDQSVQIFGHKWNRRISFHQYASGDDVKAHQIEQIFFRNSPLGMSMVFLLEFSKKAIISIENCLFGHTTLQIFAVMIQVLHASFFPLYCLFHHSFY